jgi:CheY-like chemotaxis protein
MQRILIAEDDPVLSMIYEITLTEAGFDVLLCQDGQEAFEALDRFQPDLVITDHSMPRMSGGELVSAVRKLRPDASTLMASAVRRPPAQGRPARRRAPGKARHPRPPAADGPRIEAARFAAVGSISIRA